MDEILKVNEKEYTIIKLLGKGKGGYSYLVADGEKQYVLKQIHHEPTNFVVQNGELFYIDFECNNYMEEWNFENWGVKYWSKTPEFLQYVEEHCDGW